MPRYLVTGSHPVLVGDTYRQPGEIIDAELPEAQHADLCERGNHLTVVEDAKAAPSSLESVGLPDSSSSPLPRGRRSPVISEE